MGVRLQFCGCWATDVWVLGYSFVGVRLQFCGC